MCDFFVCTCIYTRYIRQKEKERGKEEASVHARCSSFTSRWYGEGEYIHLYIGDTVRPCNELCHRDSCANRDVHVYYTLGVYGYVRYAITATKARATKKKKSRLPYVRTAYVRKYDDDRCTPEFTNEPYRYYI